MNELLKGKEPPKEFTLSPAGAGDTTVVSPEGSDSSFCKDQSIGLSSSLLICGKSKTSESLVVSTWQLQ